MSIIKTKTSQAVLKVLQECAGRAIGIRALTTYASPRIGVPATLTDIRLHLSDLEVHGYVERVASPLNPEDFEWRVTELGMEVAIPHHI
ncbi:MAG: hypothetical protein FWG50_13080 [Kiritimatiellaeota bacterium]|nr:hypothetical protein [Kiritimatiellota bacterium]